MGAPNSPIAVITGGGSGIGAASATLLCDADYRVVTWDLVGGDFECDISDESSIRSALQKTVHAVGTPHHLIASAGVSTIGTLLEQPADEWNRVLGINLTGTWLTMRTVAQAMVDARLDGSMVAVSSVSGTRADRTTGAYCVSKAAVGMLVRVAAAEWGRHGIRVNEVAPGITRTPMTPDPAQFPTWARSIEDRTVLGRIGEAQDVARTIVSVLEMDWVTGQTIVADGGLSLQSPVDAASQIELLSDEKT